MNKAQAILLNEVRKLKSKAVAKRREADDLEKAAAKLEEEVNKMS